MDERTTGRLKRPIVNGNIDIPQFQHNKNGKCEGSPKKYASEGSLNCSACMWVCGVCVGVHMYVCVCCFGVESEAIYEMTLFEHKTARKSRAQRKMWKNYANN